MSEKGDDMQSQECLVNSEAAKVDHCLPESVAERRSKKSDRRVNDNYNYMGLARRMNIDRRK